MKLSKKFIEDLHKIGEDAFIEKNQWIGKLVPDIIIDNLKKRGINQEDVEGCVILTTEEAKQVKMFLDDAVELHDKGVVVIQSTGFGTIQLIKERIEQAEKSND